MLLPTLDYQRIAIIWKKSKKVSCHMPCHKFNSRATGFAKSTLHLLQHKRDLYEGREKIRIIQELKNNRSVILNGTKKCQSL